MFSLLSGLYAYLTRREELRLLLVGLDGAGKTSALERLKAELDAPRGGAPPPRGLPARVAPTVGLNVGRFADVGGAAVVVWDLGGAPPLRGIWDKYYAEAHGLVFAVDSAEPGRLGEARAALERALASRDLDGAPLLVLATKQDAPGAAPALELRDALGLGGAAGGGGGGGGGRAVDARPASAATGEGLREAVEWLVAAARRAPRAAALRRRAAAAG